MRKRVAHALLIVCVAVWGGASGATEVPGGALAVHDAEDEMTGQALQAPLLPPGWSWFFGAIEGAIEQAVGFYSEGNLLNAASFPPEAPGLLKILRPRDRAWAADDLVGLVADAASELHEYFGASERLQLGDVARRQGGRVGLHASHQNGLDVDLAYYRVDRREQDPASVAGFDETFVRDGRLSPNFDIERNWMLMDRLVATGRVNRIFVDEAIKRTFCQHALSTGVLESKEETLRRLRVWPNHADHLHLRITCPVNSPRCVPQAEPPEGSGCDDL